MEIVSIIFQTNSTKKKEKNNSIHNKMKYEQSHNHLR